MTPTLPIEKFWTPTQLAAETDVSVQTIRNWIKSGRLQVFRLGQRQRIYESDWKRFLAKCNE